MKKIMFFLLIFATFSIFADCPRLLGSTQKTLSTGGENILRVAIACPTGSGRGIVEIYDYITGELVDAVPLSCSKGKTADRTLKNLPKANHTYRFELKCEN